jgi:hypothetical protein
VLHGQTLHPTIFIDGFDRVGEHHSERTGDRMPTALENGIRRVAVQLSPDSDFDGELLGRFVDTRDEAAFVALIRRHAAMV